MYENEALETDMTEGAAPDQAENIGADVDKMSDEDFDEYLTKTREGEESETGEKTEQLEKDAEDNKPEENASETDDTPNKDDDSEGGATPFKTFATKEEFSREVEAAVNARMQQSSAQLEQLGGLARQAATFYGTDNEKEALEHLIEDLRTQNADKQGLDIETYNKAQKDAEDARRYREQQKAETEKNNHIREIRERWNRETAELKAIIPDFDFAEAMKNQEFYNRLVNGSSVSAAYIGSGLGAVKTEAPTPKTRERRVINQNGNTNGGQGKITANPATMGETEFKNYINNIKNGMNED